MRGYRTIVREWFRVMKTLASNGECLRLFHQAMHERVNKEQGNDLISMLAHK
jgi:hypothetical protein